MAARLFVARYLLHHPGLPPLEGGALLESAGRIVAVGPAKELAADHGDAPVTDFGDAVLLPPLINAHTHLELTHFPRWAADCGEGDPPAGFVDWILRMVRVKRLITAEQLADSLIEGIRRSLAVGTGAVGDILSRPDLRGVYADAPLRGRCFLETLGRDPEVYARRLGDIAAACGESNAGGLQLGVSPHALYTLDEDHLVRAFALARRYGLGSSIHFAESAAEPMLLREGGGPLAVRLFPAAGWQERIPPADDRPLTGRLAECGGLHSSTLLVHGVHVEEADIEAIARCGATVVLCPRSNARLGVGTAPAGRYRAAGVPLALGTDSLASCASLSIWDEMAFARSCFAGQLAPSELLHMATAGGARALGLEGEMDRLAPGRGAHFQVLRSGPLPSPGELCEYLVALGGEAGVEALYLDGRDVLHNP